MGLHARLRKLSNIYLEHLQGTCRRGHLCISEKYRIKGGSGFREIIQEAVAEIPDRHQKTDIQTDRQTDTHTHMCVYPLNE